MKVRPQILGILIGLVGIGFSALYWGEVEVTMACIVALAALSNKLVEGK